MGRFKGRKIRGVILFCFVFCAVYGLPASAIKNNLFILLPLSSATRFVEKPAHPIAHPLSGELFMENEFYNLPSEELPIPIVSITTTSVCSGQTSAITIESIQSSLPDGTYTVTYDLGDANASLDNEAPMIADKGKGTFTSIHLANVGKTSIIIKSIQSDVDGSFLIIPDNNAPIYVSDAPVVTLGKTIPAICSGKTTTSLGGSVEGATNITWSSSSNGTFSDIHDPNATWTAPTNFVGTATLTLTGSNGCDAIYKSVTVEVKEMPIVQIESATALICEDGSSTLVGSYGGSATGITWTSSEDGVFSPSDTAVNATWTPGEGVSGTVILTLTTTGSPWNISDTKTIDVNASSVGGTAAPDDLVICDGSSAIIALTNNTGTIQWQQSSDNTNWVNVTGGMGSTAPTYITPDLSETTSYRAEVTNGICTSAYSNPVTVEVNPTSKGGTATATDATVCFESATTLSLANYTGTIQWQSSTDNSSFNDIEGATLPSYTTPALTATTYYKAVVTSGECPSVESNIVTVTVSPKSVAGTPTATDAAICFESGTTLSLADYTGTIQWQSSTDNSTFNDIEGATLPSYTTPALTATTYYKAVVTSGKCPSVESNIVIVTVSPKSVAGTVSSDQIVCSGDTPANISLAGQTGTIQWQSSSDNSSFTDIPSATNATLTSAQMGALTATTYYKAVVKSGECPSVESNIVTVTVSPKSVAGTVSSDQIVCSGDTPANISLAGQTGTIQWQSSSDNSSFTDISSAINATLTSVQMGALTATTYYRAVVKSGECLPAYSNAVKITVNSLPTAILSGTNDICTGSSTNLSIALTGTQPWSVTYTDGTTPVTVNNITTSPYVISVSPAATKTYTLTAVSDANCSGTSYSGSATIAVNPLPVPTIQGATTACSGSTDNTYSTESGMTNYEWNVSGGGSIIGAKNTPSITVAWNTQGAQVVSVSYTTDKGCKAVAPKNYNVTVNSLPLAPTAGNVTACYDGLAHAGTASVGAGEGLIWYSAATGGSVVSAPSGTAVGIYPAYAAARNLTTGCESATRTLVKVTINALPLAPAAGSVITCYDGIPHSGTATAGPGEGIVWYTAATGGTVTSAPTGSDAGTYTAYAAAKITATGCESATRTPVTVTIKELPKVTTSNTQVVCSSTAAKPTSTNISLKASMPSDYTWTIGTVTGTDVKGYSPGSSNGATAKIDQVLTATGNGGTVEYLVTPVSNPGGCSGPIYPITVTVQTPPVIIEPPVNVEICAGKSGDPIFAFFTAKATGNPTPQVQWEVKSGTSWIPLVDGANVVGARSNNLKITNPANGAQYRVVYTNNACTPVSATSSAVTVTIDGIIDVIAPGLVMSSCGNAGMYSFAISLQGDQVTIGYLEWYNGTEWLKVANSEQYLHNGNGTYDFSIQYSGYPKDAPIRAVLKSKKCGDAPTYYSNPVPFSPTLLIKTPNTCVGVANEKDIQFVITTGTTGGTWSVDGGGTISATGLFHPTTPGCWTAKYVAPSSTCETTSKFVVFPAIPVTPVSNTCGTKLAIPSTPVSGFTEKFSIISSPTGLTSGYITWSELDALLTSAPGCWIINSRYTKLGDCGTVVGDIVADGEPSPCTRVINAVVFPASAGLTAPSNTCDSKLTLAPIPTIGGFTAEYSIQAPGGVESAYRDLNATNSAFTNTPGCWTINAHYKLNNACGATPAGTISPCVQTVNAVVFPPAPPAPTTPGCQSPIVVTPLSPALIPNGFIVEYSFDDGSTWGISNTSASLSASCTGYKVKMRYVLAAPCGGTPAATASSFSRCSESAATLRIVDPESPTTTSTLCGTSPAVCVNKGNAYLHSGVSWDVNFTDNCVLTSTTASLSGATIAANLTTLDNVTFNVGTTTVTWSATDACNPAKTCIFTVKVNPLPVCSITGNDGPLCPLSPGNSYTAPAGMSSYLWSISGNGSIQGSNSQQSVSITTGSNKDATFTLYLTITNSNGCTSQCQKTVNVQDLQAPAFTIPTLKTGYCVENIYQAIFNNVPNGSLYDLTYLRPDYFLFAKGFTMLDLPAYSDNCALAANPIAWTIDFGNNSTIDLSGTGQLSTYLPVAPAFGIEFPVGTNRITYTVKDAVGNSFSQYVDLVVLPRPIIEKNF